MKTLFQTISTFFQPVLDGVTKNKSRRACEISAFGYFCVTRRPSCRNRPDAALGFAGNDAFIAQSL